MSRAAYPRPSLTRDNAFFWEGLAEGELRIQRCASCGMLRHPPGPRCPGCHAAEWDHVCARGTGTIHSFVVAEHPAVPPFEYPNVIVLVDLVEGTRLISRLVGVEPDAVEIGQPVRVAFETVDDDLALHFFRPLEA